MVLNRLGDALWFRIVCDIRDGFLLLESIFSLFVLFDQGRGLGLSWALCLFFFGLTLGLLYVCDLRMPK